MKVEKYKLFINKIIFKFKEKYNYFKKHDLEKWHDYLNVNKVIF